VTDSVARPSLSFLLRLWAEANGADWVWRASVADLQGSAMTGFADMEAALAFIRAAVASEQQPAGHHWSHHHSERNSA